MKTTLNGIKSNIVNVRQGLQLEYYLIPILEVRITGGGRAKKIIEVLMGPGVWA